MIASMVWVARGWKVGAARHRYREKFGDHLDPDTLLGRLGVDLVVYVGDVGGIEHGVLAISAAQQPEQQVEDHHRPEIADMAEVIDRRPADIHRHALRVVRDERPLGAGHGVVECQSHGQANAG